MRKIPEDLIEEYEALMKVHLKDKSNLQNHIEIADFFLDSGLFRYAIDEYLDVLLLNQTTDVDTKINNNIYLKLGVAYINIKKHHAAVECFAKCDTDENTLSVVYSFFKSTYHPINEAVLIDQFIESVDIMLYYDNYEMISKAVLDLLTTDINDFSIFVIGKKMFNQGLYELAIRCFQRALELNDLIITRYFKAKAHFNEKEYRTGVEDVKKLIALEPDDIDFLFLRGQFNYFLYEYEESYEDFTRILNENPEYEEINYWLSKTLYQLFSYERALKHINVELNKEVNEKYLLLKSKIYFGDQQYTESLKYALEVLETNQNVEIITYIQNIYLELNKFIDGIELGLKYAFNRNVNYNNYMGNFYFNTKQYDKSLEHYKHVLNDKNFHQHKINYYCGYCYEMENDNEKAIKHYLKSLEIKHDYNPTIERLKNFNEE